MQELRIFSQVLHKDPDGLIIGYAALWHANGLFRTTLRCA
jgi:hypothetical protein